MKTPAFFCVVAATALAGISAAEEKQPPKAAPLAASDVELIRDVEFGKGGSRTLHMHIARPKGEIKNPLPAIVFVHGGAWRGGHRNAGLPFATGFAQQGFIGATIEYRFSQEAKFPAQIEDCKCAIRFLREHAAEYHIDPDRIGVMGASAGGHLVALLGTTANEKEFEGTGGSEKFSSRVQAVCDWFGPADLTRMHEGKSTIDHASPNSPESLLIGGTAAENPDKAKRASPITYVSGDSAPILIMHGDQDQLVPVAQSESFAAALKKAGVDVTLHVIKGAGHGGPGFNTEDVRHEVQEFFNRHLKSPAKN